MNKQFDYKHNQYKNTGGPVYPSIVSNNTENNLIGFVGEVIKPGHQVHYGGMTIRDYFAAAAMQGVLSNGNTIFNEGWMKGLAKGSYEIADAMLEARG